MGKQARKARRARVCFRSSPMEGHLSLVLQGTPNFLMAICLHGKLLGWAFMLPNILSLDKEPEVS